MKSKLWKLLLIPFPKVNLDETFITFGKRVYHPLGKSITEDLAIHESTHISQQKNSYIYACFWCLRYLLSNKFRYSQELQAYKNQYIFLMSIYKDRNVQSKILSDITNMLSGDMYNNLVTREQAIKDLTNT